jgi:hypothetical protein
MGSPSGSHAPSTICMALLWTLWVRPGTFSFHIFVDRGRDLYGKLLFMGFRVSLPHSILVVSQFYSSSFLYFSLESVGFYFGGPPPCFIVAFCSVLFWQHPRCNLVDSKGFTLAVLFCFGSGRLLGIILVFSQVLFWQRWHSPKEKSAHA